MGRTYVCVNRWIRGPERRICIARDYSFFPDPIYCTVDVGLAKRTNGSTDICNYSAVLRIRRQLDKGDGKASPT